MYRREDNIADLVTHFTIARFFTTAVKDARMRLIFYLGTFLPDLLYKFFLHLTRTDEWALVPTHTPIGLLFYCYITTMLFEEKLRAKIFISLFLGSLLHIFVDLFKNNLGFGSSFLLYPFSDKGYEFGLYQAEDILYILPLNLLIIVALELIVRKYKNV